MILNFDLNVLIKMLLYTYDFFYVDDHKTLLYNMCLHSSLYDLIILCVKVPKPLSTPLGIKRHNVMLYDFNVVCKKYYISFFLKKNKNFSHTRILSRVV